MYYTIFLHVASVSAPNEDYGESRGIQLQAPINELCADDDEPEMLSERGSTVGDGEEVEGEEGEKKEGEGEKGDRAVRRFFLFGSSVKELLIAYGYSIRVSKSKYCRLKTRRSSTRTT